jgi:hypothetical protein
MSYHATGALGVISPAGQAWNTPTYQACAGHSIQMCGYYNETQGWTPQQLSHCIDAEQQKCIAIAQAALATVLSSAQIKAMQAAINAALQKYDYCPIAVDGNLGPETCGAAAWAAGIGAPVSVPGVCGSKIPMGSGFLKDCKQALPTLPVLPPPPVKPPVVPPPPVAPPAYKPPVKKANIMVVGAVATMVAGGGYWLAKKKGWVK